LSRAGFPLPDPPEVHDYSYAPPAASRGPRLRRLPRQQRRGTDKSGFRPSAGHFAPSASSMEDVPGTPERNAGSPASCCWRKAINARRPAAQRRFLSRAADSGSVRSFLCPSEETSPVPQELVTPATSARRQRRVCPAHRSCKPQKSIRPRRNRKTADANRSRAAVSRTARENLQSQGGARPNDSFP
jgi:hypothetical protein